MLSNLSNYKGVVTADAVRLGGGISNIVRGDSTMFLPIGSDLPRCLEAARYSAQGYGMPDSVYSRRGNDDYSDDINYDLAQHIIAQRAKFARWFGVGDRMQSTAIECLLLSFSAGTKRPRPGVCL